MSQELPAKIKLKKKFGTLRLAARELGFSRFNLSELVNGWKKPTSEDLKKLKLTEQDFKFKNN